MTVIALHVTRFTAHHAFSHIFCHADGFIFLIASISTADTVPAAPRVKLAPSATTTGLIVFFTIYSSKNYRAAKPACQTDASMIP